MDAGGKGDNKRNKRKEKKQRQKQNRKEKERNLAKSRHDDTELDDEEVSEKMVGCCVKVYAVITELDYERPWSKTHSLDATGSGFVIPGRRILTNAHVVESATFVAVRAMNSSKRWEAKVVATSYECDLALLTVEDPAFYKGLPECVKWSKSEPHIMDEVVVAGFPEGGDTLSLTRGIVSRLEHGQYTETLDMLTIQIDAAVNPGNSGGPVFFEDEVIGVAFSGLDEADGISYVIPTRIVQHFLEDIRRNSGRFSGICDLGFHWQTMENVSLRRARGLKDGQTGVLVNFVDPESPCHGLVEPGDVLTALDGVPIDSDGTIPWRKRERLDLMDIVQHKYPGDPLKVSVWRKGKTMDFAVTSKVVRPLVPDKASATSDYLLYCGLLLVPLSIPLLESLGDGDWEAADDELSVLTRTRRRKFPDEEIVILVRIYTEAINFGYEECELNVLRTINGEEIRNLKHAYRVLRSVQTPIVEMTFGDNVICLDRMRADEATKQILKEYMIPAPTNMTPD